MKSVAVLDAAVLVPKGLRDLLLSCAAAGAFRPIWQEELLDELIRSCIKVDAKHARKHGIEPDIVALTASARRLADTMNRAFPDACLASARWRPRVAQMTNHERDRHVIAAAIGVNATHVVTNNLKDFPAASRHGVTVQRPDPYLVGLLTDPETSALVVAGVTAMASRHRRPAHTPQELAKLISTGRFTAKFGAELLTLIA